MVYYSDDDQSSSPNEVASNGHVNSELPLLKGKKRSGNSENAGGDASEKKERKFRLGRQYQASIPCYIPVNECRPELIPDRGLPVWAPAVNINEEKLDEYVQIAREKYGYNGEQALGMLFYCNYNLDRSIQELAGFTPISDKWTVEDKVLFEQAFLFHGKFFRKIHEMLPCKSIPMLVEYYYDWKKTRKLSSLMDRQIRMYQGQYGEKLQDEVQEFSFRKPKCINCKVLCDVAHPTPKGRMCGTCHLYYRRTGTIRPIPAAQDETKKPPRGMYINHDDLVPMAAGSQFEVEALLKSMTEEIVSCKTLFRNNLQYITSLQRRIKDRSPVEPYRLPTNSDISKINASWTDEELLLGVQGIRIFGKNFKLISEVIGTKTEQHVRWFFSNYRHCYNLDDALKEYEVENGLSDDVDDMQAEDAAEQNENGSKD